MIELTEVRKLVTFSYDTGVVMGKTAHVSAMNPAEENTELEEKKEIPNDGSGTFAFKVDYEGEVYMEIHGSAGGMESATITV